MYCYNRSTFKCIVTLASLLQASVYCYNRSTFKCIVTLASLLQASVYCYNRSILECIVTLASLLQASVLVAAGSGGEQVAAAFIAPRRAAPEQHRK